jgi:hypothetical protein
MDDRRRGHSTRHRANILASPIPPGFFGRGLTNKECAALRKLGIQCSTRWHVVRQVGDIPHLGICYYPGPGGDGFTHAGVYVGTID